MGRKKKPLMAPGVESKGETSPSPERPAPGSSGVHMRTVIRMLGSASPVVESRLVGLSEILPPSNLARPLDDGEYFQSLRDSMREVGQLDPVIAVRVPGGVRIADGWHRFNAAKDLGWSNLWCNVFADLAIAEEAVQLHANQVHKEMTAWEEHLFYMSLCERMKLSFEDACRYTRKSEQYVSDRLRLADLQPETKEALRTNQISLSLALQLLRVKDRMWELYFLDLCLRSGTGAKVLQGWVTKHLMEHVQPTAQDVAAAQTPLPPPPPVPDMICGICDREASGEQMVQVWVHLAELQQIRNVLRATFRQAAGEETGQESTPKEG